MQPDTNTERKTILAEKVVQLRWTNVYWVKKKACAKGDRKQIAELRTELTSCACQASAAEISAAALRDALTPHIRKERKSL